MKHGILKRVIALCVAGGVMALTLTACGDSENNNEGEGTVLDVSQGSEDGTVDVAKNEETDTVDPSGNDVRVAHASSSGNSGNGFAIPVFKPGEEPDSGEEPKPGEGNQKPQQSQSSTGAQSGAGTQQPQQPQPSAGTQKPQSNTGTQQPQQPQQPQQSQPSAGTQQPQQPSTGNQTVHTHSWVTETIHHKATGHYESRVTGTETVVIPNATVVYYCRDCNLEYNRNTMEADHAAHVKETGHYFIPSYKHVSQTETRDIVEDVWVQDTAAWDETVTTCSTCGAKQ